MRASDIPAKMPVVWASSAPGADVHQVPTPSQIGITNGAASFTDGFPPLNFLPVASGGVAPFGEDFNGILQQMTAWNQWQQLGGPVSYDGTFASAIAGLGTAGYPRGASIAAQLGTGNVVPGASWISLSDGNTTNPEPSGGSGWSQMFALNGTATLNVSGNTDVTLTPAQYGYKNIWCNGTLTGNINLIFPVNGGPWTICNNTAGIFQITGKVAGGVGTFLGQGHTTTVWSDGATVRNIIDYISSPMFVDSSLTVSGGITNIFTNHFSMGSGAISGTWYNIFSLSGLTSDAFELYVSTIWNTTTSIAKYNLLCNDGSYVLTLIAGGGLVALQMAGGNLQAQQTAQASANIRVTWKHTIILQQNTP